MYDYGFVSSTSESTKVNQDFSGQHLLGMYMPTSTVQHLARKENICATPLYIVALLLKLISSVSRTKGLRRYYSEIECQENC